jgi:hypothetical protein
MGYAAMPATMPSGSTILRLEGRFVTPKQAFSLFQVEVEAFPSFELSGRNDHILGVTVSIGPAEAVEWGWFSC